MKESTTNGLIILLCGIILGMCFLFTLFFVNERSFCDVRFEKIDVRFEKIDAWIDSFFSHISNTEIHRVE